MLAKGIKHAAMSRPRQQPSDRRARTRKQPAKVAITLRLGPEQVRQLQTAAKAENRALTNYVETALLRDLSHRDEAARVITMYAVPGTSPHIRPEDIVRGEGESEQAYAERRDLLVVLWSIPDSE